MKNHTKGKKLINVADTAKNCETEHLEKFYESNRVYLALCCETTAELREGSSVWIRQVHWQGSSRNNPNSEPDPHQSLLPRPGSLASDSAGCWLAERQMEERGKSSSARWTFHLLWGGIWGAARPPSSVSVTRHWAGYSSDLRGSSDMRQSSIPAAARSDNAKRMKSSEVHPCRRVAANVCVQHCELLPASARARLVLLVKFSRHQLH